MLCLPATPAAAVGLPPAAGAALSCREGRAQAAVCCRAHTGVDVSRAPFLRARALHLSSVTLSAAGDER